VRKIVEQNLILSIGNWLDSENLVLHTTIQPDWTKKQNKKQTIKFIPKTRKNICQMGI